jgi:hypothetical protein
MKTLACVLLMSCGSAFAQTSINLSTPNTIALNPVVSTFGCYAASVTTRAYSTVVTGFSVDGNYVQGQVSAYFTCGHSGRGSTVHTVYSCAQLTWDLSGNLVGAVAPIAYNNGQPVSSYCPTVSLTYPSNQPPSTEVIGNEFMNAGGYVAETLLAEACGAIACYATYYYPTLLTP